MLYQVLGYAYRMLEYKDGNLAWSYEGLVWKEAP